MSSAAIVKKKFDRNSSNSTNKTLNLEYMQSPMIFFEIIGLCFTNVEHTQYV
jgi:hypothetical protein